MISKTHSGVEKVSSDEADEIQKLPLLEASLPFTFADGGTLGDIGISCGGCGKALGSHQIHGSIEGKLNGSVAVLTGFGVCFSCRTLSPCEVKFYSDGNSLHKKDNTWVKERWSPEHHTFTHRVSLYVYGRWQTLIPPVIAAIIIAGWMLKR